MIGCSGIRVFFFCNIGNFDFPFNLKDNSLQLFPYRIAAISSVSGSMLVDSFRDSYYNLGFCSPVHPTAILLIPGTADFSPHSTYAGFQPYYMSADEITSYWSTYLSLIHI